MDLRVLEFIRKTPVFEPIYHSKNREAGKKKKANTKIILAVL